MLFCADSLHSYCICDSEWVTVAGYNAHAITYVDSKSVIADNCRHIVIFSKMTPFSFTNPSPVMHVFVVCVCVCVAWVCLGVCAHAFVCVCVWWNECILISLKALWALTRWGAINNLLLLFITCLQLFTIPSSSTLHNSYCGLVCFGNGIIAVVVFRSWTLWVTHCQSMQLYTDKSMPLGEKIACMAVLLLPHHMAAAGCLWRRK